jgi:hypothetical protein
MKILNSNYVHTPQAVGLAIPEMSPVRQAIGAAGAAAGAYHGYKRNNSIGWAIGWALLGGLFPIITVPVSLAQGFGKKKKK